MLSEQSHLFNLPEEVSYLNCAYMSPQLLAQTKIAEVRSALMEQPFRVFSEDFFSPVKQFKSSISQLINVEEQERIVPIPSVSYGMANVARNVDLKPGAEILLLEEQFPSNVYIWQRVAEKTGAIIKFIAGAEGPDKAAQWNQNILEAINDQTAVISLGHVHWADGTTFDLEAIRAKTKAHNALMVIDGTQSVGAFHFDVAQLDPDALVCAGYKWLFGPYSTGFAYYGAAFDNGLPIEENWISRKGSEKFGGLVNYEPEYKPFANRYGMGEQSNFSLIPMLQVAIDQLLKWGVDNIQTYCAHLMQPIIQDLLDMGCKIEWNETRCKHLIGIRLGNEFDVEELKNLFQAQKVFVSFRGTAIRVAPNVYNNAEDISKLLNCFKQARKKQLH